MRSDIFDSRTQPVENLATNPSFERVVVGTTVIRKNLAPNPAATIVNPTYWYRGGGSADIISTHGVEELQFPGKKANEIVATHASTNPTYFYSSPSSGANAISMSQGKTVTTSIYVKNLSSPSRQFRIELVSRDSSGNGFVEASAESPAVDTGGIYRLSCTGSVRAGTMYIHMNVRMLGNISPGDTFRYGSLLIEERPGLLPYFDGTTADNTGIAYSWEGAIDASASTARASTIELRRNFQANPSGDPTGSSAGVTNGNGGGTVSREGTGGRSRPSTWLYTTGATAAQDKGPQLRPSLTIGTTYTVSCYVKASGLFTPLGIRLGYYDGAAWLGSGSYSTTINAWTRLSHTFTATTTGGSAVIGAPQQNNQVGVDFLFTDILIEASPSLGGFFDGSTTPDTDLAPAWTGIENASASVLHGTTVPALTNTSSIRSYSAQSSTLLRVLGGHSSADGYAPFQLMSIPSLAVPDGKTFTILATCTVPTGVIGTDFGPLQARNLFVAITGGGGVTRGLATTTPSPKTAGTYTHRLVVKVPKVNGDPVTSLQLRLYKGQVRSEPDIYWGKLAIIEGTYTGPYLDGDMPGCVWRGTPHNSTSVGYGAGA